MEIVTREQQQISLRRLQNFVSEKRFGLLLKTIEERKSHRSMNLLRIRAKKLQSDFDKRTEAALRAKLNQNTAISNLDRQKVLWLIYQICIRKTRNISKSFSAIRQLKNNSDLLTTYLFISPNKSLNDPFDFIDTIFKYPELYALTTSIRVDYFAWYSMLVSQKREMSETFS